MIFWLRKCTKFCDYEELNNSQIPGDLKGEGSKNQK